MMNIQEFIEYLYAMPLVGEKIASVRHKYPFEDEDAWEYENLLVECEDYRYRGQEYAFDAWWDVEKEEIEVLGCISLDNINDIPRFEVPMTEDELYNYIKTMGKPECQLLVEMRYKYFKDDDYHDDLNVLFYDQDQEPLWLYDGWDYVPEDVEMLGCIDIQDIKVMGFEPYEQ